MSGCVARPLTLERIYERCDEVGECLLWKHACNQDNGLPQVHHEGKTRGVRRLVFELDAGRAPRKGYCIATTCRETRCLNRAHLVEYTRKQLVERNAKLGLYNTKAGLVAKTLAARRLRGSLTMEIVREARRLRGEGLMPKAIGELIGVDRRLVSHITTGRSWRELGASVFNLG